MAEINDLSKSSQIRNLILILFFGVGTAFILFLAMLHFYGPTGTYLAKNMLLSPETARLLHYPENTLASSTNDSRSGPTTIFVFDLIEFSYYDITLKQVKRIDVDMGKYAEFYAMISNDKSLPDDSSQVKDGFIRPAAYSSLIFKIRTESKALRQTPSNIFTEIDLTQGDYYRILLRDQSAPEKWAYFYHPGIYKYVHELFTSKL